jgi:hypothetical protein
MEHWMALAARQHGVITRAQLRRAGLWRFLRRESRPGRRGVGVLRRLLGERDPDYQPSASRFQAEVRALLTRAGLSFVELS